jgi:hypothetical protein
MIANYGDVIPRRDFEATQVNCNPRWTEFQKHISILNKNAGLYKVWIE